MPETIYSVFETYLYASGYEWAVGCFIHFTDRVKAEAYADSLNSRSLGGSCFEVRLSDSTAKCDFCGVVHDGIIRNGR